MDAMPLYEYRCRDCDSVFELRRTMAEANDPISCPDGHPGAVRLLSVFAATGRSSAGGGMQTAMAPMGGGGGCGGACACHG
jgi:putative FmdB family regulatory protein